MVRAAIAFFILALVAFVLGATGIAGLFYRNRQNSARSLFGSRRTFIFGVNHLGQKP